MNNRKKLLYFWIFLLLLLSVSSCLVEPTSAPSPIPPTKPVNPTPTDVNSDPKTTHIVISEVLAGVSGNNNQEFIELHNPDAQIIDLDGWSIWYRLPSSSEDLLVYRWTEQTLIPPQGHYLLTRIEQSFPLSADAEFDQNINTASGGIQLRGIDGNVVDSLGWGTAPDGYAEEEPAKSMLNGISLERLPGGSQGNNQDTNSNQTDFVLNESPNPQNSGSPITPFADQGIQVSLSAPESVEPGSNFTYVLTVKNTSTENLSTVSVIFPVLPDLTIFSLPTGIEQTGETYTWETGQIPASGSTQVSIPVSAPWTYTTLTARNYFATAQNTSFAIFGSPVWTKVEGGVIPIATARNLINAELTIEGIATMYTGGYFAGGGNTKFYLQDETGGIQVQVFGGDPSVRVALGSKVRVRGKIGVYRNSIQIVPINVPDDVEIISRETAPQAQSILLSQAVEDLQNYPGRLIQVDGLVSRIEEFTYSYEIDLTGPQNDTLTLYVDKQTNINVEFLETGFELAASGILDDRDSFRLLYPRIQEDLIRKYPESLFLDADIPIAIQPGEIFTITLKATNHTPDSISDLSFFAKIPNNTELISVSEQGEAIGNELSWQIPLINGNGESVQVNYQVKPNTTVDQITIEDYKITSPDYPSEVIGQPVHLFSSGIVPIWAIQGESYRSPYVGKTLTTQGLVTGVFPELSGFWIQNLDPDESVKTSEGVFVLFEEIQDQVALGDLVEVSGIVREASQQTTLDVAGIEQVEILNSNLDLPQAYELDPPDSWVDSAPYFEALEGMLVSLEGPALAVSPVTKYGEYVLVHPSHALTRLFQGEDNGMMIMVDDGSSTTHMDSSTLPYLINSGDKVSNLIGPLAYTYGRYKVEPISEPDLIIQEKEIPFLMPTGEDEFSIMSWNVENLFDVLDPHPSSPPRPKLAEYKRDIEKVANTILAAGTPTIVALQEVENIGILEDIASHPILMDYAYQTVLIEGFDSRGIDVGYLVREDLAEILDVEQLPGPNGLTSRPPLNLHVLIKTSLGQTGLYVINNHFTSMSAGVEATEPVRTAQAEWNAEIVQMILKTDPDARIAVVGDLNSFLNSEPIRALLNAGLIHGFDQLPKGEQYTYIYEGESQVLDHIIVNASLYEIFDSIDVLRVNADYALLSIDDLSAIGKSDHDPVVATFKIR